MNIRSSPIAAEYETLARRSATRARGFAGELWADKARLRRVAMTWGVAAVVVVSLVLWLTGGRYVSTDDSYVHAAKLMVSTDVSGLVKDVDVHEGQHVVPGQILFRLDAAPFQIALDNAKASLAQSVQDVEATKAMYQSILGQLSAQNAQVDLARLTYNRYAALARANAIAPTQLDQARSTLQSAHAMTVTLKQNAQQQLDKLNGNPNLPARQAPEYLKAKSTVDEMQRQLDHTVVRAPFEGNVAEVDSLQPGTLVISAMSAFTTTSAVGIISTKNVWVEASMKETDLTYVRQGNPVEVTVDSYPGCSWNGVVDAISAGSDSSFSALPSENTGGNWVKVVQRIPVRVKLGGGNCSSALRAGMSAYISIDTGRRRWNRMLFGN